jgi:hypothetical protein
VPIAFAVGESTGDMRKWLSRFFSSRRFLGLGTEALLVLGLCLIVSALVDLWFGDCLGFSAGWPLVLGAVMDLVCRFKFQHSTMRYSYRGKVGMRISMT